MFKQPTIVAIEELPYNDNNEFNSQYKQPSIISKKIDNAKENFKKINKFNKEKIKRGSNWTAFNRENIASIPTRNEYLLIKNDDDNRKVGFSNQSVRFKQINNFDTPGPGSYMLELNSIKKNASFQNPSFNNSKGFGALISETERFDYSNIYKQGYIPGPSDYTNLPGFISHKENDLDNITRNNKYSTNYNSYVTEDKSFISNINSNNNNSFSQSNINNKTFSSKKNQKNQTNLINKSNQQLYQKNNNIETKINNHVKKDIEFNQIEVKELKKMIVEENNRIPIEKNNLKIKGKTFNKIQKNSFKVSQIPGNFFYDTSNLKVSKPKIMINYQRDKTQRFGFDKTSLTNPGPTSYFLRPEEYKNKYNLKMTNADTFDNIELNSCNQTNSNFYKTLSNFQRKTSSEFNSLMNNTTKTNSVFHSKLLSEMLDKDKKEDMMLKTFMFAKVKYNTGKPKIKYDSLNKYVETNSFNIKRSFDKYAKKVNDPHSNFMSLTQRVYSKEKPSTIVPGPAFYSPEKLPSKTSYNANLGNWI